MKLTADTVKVSGSHVARSRPKSASFAPRPCTWATLRCGVKPPLKERVSLNAGTARHSAVCRSMSASWGSGRSHTLKLPLPCRKVSNVLSVTSNGATSQPTGASRPAASVNLGLGKKG